MRPLSLLFAALLLAPVACSRRVAPPLPAATAQEPTLPLAANAPAKAPAPSAEPDPEPTAEEVAAFHAKVPK